MDRLKNVGFVKGFEYYCVEHDIMEQFLQLMLLLTLFASCNFMPDTSENRLRILYRQRIPNSKLVIYDFSFEGGFVTSSDYAGYAILDSTISFSRNRIKELPCTYFSAKPTNSIFKMINIEYGQNPRTESDTLLIPTKRYTKKVDDIQIEVIEYNDTYGSAISTGLKEYEFDGLMETVDSLTFYKVTKKFGDEEFPSAISFVKGNIKIIDSTGGNINYIEIDQMTIKRGDIYKPSKPLQLVPNQPIVGMTTYYFYPRQVTKTITLTDYGIFKQVK